jgi:hypothetical protein
MISCKSEGEVSLLGIERNELLTFMAGDWGVIEVRKDNVLITDFQSLTISFDDLQFTSIGGGIVWPASGSFIFVDDETATEFVRMDGKSFSAVIVAKDLTINISYKETNSREGIEGNYQFTLSKN